MVTTELFTYSAYYSIIANARFTYARIKPVLEKILEYKESKQRFTASMIGEAIMGDKYHAMTERNYEGRPCRSKEAMSLSSTIGHALHILRKYNEVGYVTERDMNHPHTFEDEVPCYTFDGKELPEIMKIPRCNGKAYMEIHARDVVGVKLEWKKKTVTRYPSVDWYFFK